MTWNTLKDNHYVPRAARSAENEPRNGVTMCMSHHDFFDKYFFYIRYVDRSKQFIFVNHSGISELAQFHGKAILLDINHRHAPFPATFLIHEQRVRGYWPFAKPPTIPTSTQLPQQDWIISGPLPIFSAGANTSTSSGHEGPSYAAAVSGSSQTATETGQSSNILDLNNETIQEILLAT